MEREEVAADREVEEVAKRATPSEEEPASDGISAVIPGWFSEISPMWPGPRSVSRLFLSVTLLPLELVWVCAAWFSEYSLLLRVQIRFAVLGFGYGAPLE
ncbi:hypothetical protein ZIOFF_032168 [Zingiber officinale]|uniref:Uncharacterized protein n=1 Tax=Zingiber officinale TaxID=94328 RepID=A0A8J5GIM7_ZINOF|nr:hypothetical protein ZIOFF_032168 [Zingiber officinale]